MKKRININFLPETLLIISFIILFIRAFYSFCWSDESFYLATAKRFYEGDSIFYHEWFPTQLSSLLLVPLYSIYVSIKGSTEGILLFFRLIFVILELLSSLYVYIILKKHHGALIGTIAALLSQWYVHLNIATLSYYTITIHCFLLTMLILYDYYKDTLNGINTNKNNTLKLVLAGFLFAIAVLCLPTMTVAYFLIVFAGFILTALGKIFPKFRLLNCLLQKLDFIRVFFKTLIGICVPAVIFLIYLFTHVSLKNFINSIPYILSDDEHITNAIYPIKKMYLSINESFGRLAYLSYLLIIVSIAIFVITLAIKHTESTSLKDIILKTGPFVKIGILLADTVIFIAFFAMGYKYTGYIFTVITLFALPLFLLTENKNWIIFSLLYISGFIYSLVYSYSSNGMLYIISMGHFIAAIGSIVLIYDFLSEITGDKLKPIQRFCIPFFVCLMVVCILDVCHLRITNVYRDDTLSKLTEIIPNGPAKGLHTSKAHLDLYENVIDTIDTYCMKDSFSGSNSDVAYNNLLISNLLPFGYLYSDMSVAAPTVWRNPMGSLRLKEYYELHPDRIPDVVFLANENNGTYETCGDVEFDPTPNLNDKDGFMYDFVKKRNYEMITAPSGVIYLKR